MLCQTCYISSYIIIFHVLFFLVLATRDLDRKEKIEQTTYALHKFISLEGLVGLFTDRERKHTKPALEDKI